MSTLTWLLRCPGEVHPLQVQDLILKLLLGTWRDAARVELSICPPACVAEEGCGYLGAHSPPVSSLVGLWGLLGFTEHPCLLSPVRRSHPRWPSPNPPSLMALWTTANSEANVLDAK